MKKTLILTSLLSVLSFGALAEEMPQPPVGGQNIEKHHHGGMMVNLTEEQKSCIEAYGCKMPERPNIEQNMQKPEPGQRPEMTDEQKESMECMKKAMESCGIEMPKRPEHPSGEKPNHPTIPDMPPAPDMPAIQ